MILSWILIFLSYLLSFWLLLSLSISCWRSIEHWFSSGTISSVSLPLLPKFVLLYFFQPRLDLWPRPVPSPLFPPSQWWTYPLLSSRICSLCCSQFVYLIFLISLVISLVVAVSIFILALLLQGSSSFARCYRYWSNFSQTHSRQLPHLHRYPNHPTNS